MQISYKIEKYLRDFLFFLCYSLFGCSYTTQVYKQKHYKTIREIYRMEQTKKIGTDSCIIDREKDWEKMDGQHRDKQKECEMTDNHKNSKKEEWYQGTDRKSTKNK